MYDNDLNPEPSAEKIQRSHVLAWFPGGRRSGDPAYPGWDLYPASAWDNGGPMPARSLTLLATLDADAEQLASLVADRLGRGVAAMVRGQFEATGEPGWRDQVLPLFDIYTQAGQ